ncbi:hypothetical protein SASPL_114953 [Salvia splendens]|uniref:Uncharacterized protein n=1 Tax=Salvia splendens TaxID=180675 RepID=A0A8X8Y6L7_SALSN|nr:hypothetical protein SASPL_114953 [Salvia splendens]
MRLPAGRREGSMDYVVYDDDMVELSKRKFSTLKPHEVVDVGVVDAWAWYLNRMEEEESAKNPRRLFATTSPTTGVADVLDIVVPENGIPDATKYERDLGLLATNDSAVFLMRHMEAYKGNPDNLKAIGLQGASGRILQILRGRYCKNMLLAPFNIDKERFLSYMSHYINVTPTFRTDYARQVNCMLNKAPSNELCNQPARMSLFEVDDLFFKC